MSGVWKRFLGSGTGGDPLEDEDYTRDKHGQVTKDNFDIVACGVWCQNVYAGGDDQNGISCDATGDFDLFRWTPIQIDNTNNQITSFTDPDYGAVVVKRFRFYIVVNDVGIAAGTTVTPKLRRGTLDTSITTSATISGQAACSAGSADFSGTNQKQYVSITIPSGVTFWKAQITVGGTPAPGAEAFVRAYYDCYIQR